MLNKRPDLYAKGVIDLTFYGETTFARGNKLIRLPNVLRKKIDYSIIPREGKIVRTDLGTISLSDFVLGVSLVYSEKVLQKVGLLWNNSTHSKANVGNFLFASTMPWELDDYFKAIGIKDIFKRYYSPFMHEDKVLEKIVQAVENGEMPILMENHLLTADRHKNLFYKIFGAHFISVHRIQINDDCNTVSLSYWDYGSVKNHRDQSEKGSPLAAKTLHAAIRRNNRLNKVIKDDKYLELSKELFFKGLKGYWIPNYTTHNIKHVGAGRKVNTQ